MRSVVLLAVIVLAPSSAHAYKPAPWSPEVAELEVPDSLRIVREVLTVKCTVDGVVITCAVDHAIELENPSAQAVDATVTARATDMDVLTITHDGRSASDLHKDTAMSPEALAAPLSLTLAPHTHTNVVVHVVLTGRTHWAGGELETGALAARHPILALTRANHASREASRPSSDYGAAGGSRGLLRRPFVP